MSKEKEARFEKAAFGYRPEDVDRYIAEADKKLAAAKAEKAELLSKMKILADKITEYRSDEGNLKEAMLGAQRMKASIENDAKAKADTTISEAQDYANQLISDAQAKSSQMVADAQERANKMVAEAQKTAEQKVNSVTSQVERERQNLAQLQKEVSSFKNKLISLYREHLNLITNLPEQAKAALPAKEEKAAEPETDAPAADAFTEKFGEVDLK